MIKSALTAAILLGTVSVGLASEFDGNITNRYPQASAARVLEGRNVALTGNRAVSTQNSYTDRASQSFGGGY